VKSARDIFRGRPSCGLWGKAREGKEVCWPKEPMDMDSVRQRFVRWKERREKGKEDFLPILNQNAVYRPGEDWKVLR